MAYELKRILVKDNPYKIRVQIVDTESRAYAYAYVDILQEPELVRQSLIIASKAVARRFSKLVGAEPDKVIREIKWRGLENSSDELYET